MSQSTEDALLRSASRLFAQKGYEGSSVRAITAAANANLGAITYHFGSKQALYEAVLNDVVIAFRKRLAEAALEPGHALDRIDRVLRAAFDYMSERPELPRLIVQRLATGTGLPEVVSKTMHANIHLVAKLIRDGQGKGLIRKDDPLRLALSVGAQPMLWALLREALHEAVSLDQGDVATREALTKTATQFVRMGLAAGMERAR